MKKVIVNSLKLNCSEGRIEKGETVVLSDVEIAKITKIRPDILTVLEEVKPERKVAAKPATKTVRKTANANVKPFK
tara:strand:+ start:392 stop:619 length:228 start_codon:yes stop_codon:yes gene_type:complete